MPNLELIPIHNVKLSSEGEGDLLTVKQRNPFEEQF